MVYGYEDNHRQFSLVDPGVFGVFGWGLVTNPGFFGTGWPIWLQVRLLFPEIATIPPPKP
ncbi:phosphatidylglycerophosphatase [Mobiluncus mulieris]|nr:phosphatidylglycerophosphatase [Mobiluncus mulieris]